MRQKQAIAPILKTYGQANVNQGLKVNFEINITLNNYLDKFGWEVLFVNNVHWIVKTAASYKYIGDGRPCCISGSRLHQNCLCAGTLSDCKSKCDHSNYCKGYAEVVSGTYNRQCLLATVSSICPSGCSLYWGGNVGTLLVNGTCLWEKGGGMDGCHIKEEYGMYIIYRFYWGKL